MTYKIEKLKEYDQNDINYLGGIPPLVKWWTFKYKNFFINTYHTPTKDGFKKYIDKNQFFFFRKNLNMSQKQFSKFLGISIRSICRIENGYPVSLRIFWKLEKFFGKENNILEQ